MNYFRTTHKIAHMNALIGLFEKIIAIEISARQNAQESGRDLSFESPAKRARDRATATSPEYQDLRRQYAMLIPTANKICDQEQIPYYLRGYSAPIEGGSPFQGSMFALVLERPSNLIDLDTSVRDTIHQTLGALKESQSVEFRKLINPAYWLGQGFAFVVRLPFSLLKLSGFDVDKIQEHLIARVFQLIYVIALIIVFAWFGLETILDLTSFLP